MSTITPCTSSNRPTASTGRIAFETDTNNIIVYDGTNWRGYQNDGVSGWSGTNAYSMNFDGTDDRLNVGSVITPTATSGTISAWIKTTSTAYQAIFSTADIATVNTWGWMAVFNNKLRITFRESGGTVKIADGSTTINDGTWHHVMAVSSGTAYNLYVDGSAETLTNSNNDGTWFGDLIGLDSSDIASHVRTSAGNFFNGNIDEVAVWDSDQSSNISTIYNSGTPGNLLPLSPNHWWRMGDGIEANSGSTVYDMSLNNVNATIVNQANFDNTTAP